MVATIQSQPEGEIISEAAKAAREGRANYSRGISFAYFFTRYSRLSNFSFSTKSELICSTAPMT
jgi:hypothetical protein